MKTLKEFTTLQEKKQSPAEAYAEWLANATDGTYGGPRHEQHAAAMLLATQGKLDNSNPEIWRVVDKTAKDLDKAIKKAQK